MTDDLDRDVAPRAVTAALREVATWLRREGLPDTDVHLQYWPDTGHWQVHTGAGDYLTDHCGYVGTGMLEADATAGDIADLVDDLIAQIADALAVDDLVDAEAGQ